MPGNGLFFEKSNDGLIWPPGGRRTLGGGRASWLVTFDVIIQYTKQTPRKEKEGEERGRKRERNPPPKSPPGKKREGGRGEKEADERKKIL